jgi:hypothetical protein
MALRFKSMGYKMKPSSLSPMKQSPLKQQENTKQQSTGRIVNDIVNEEQNTPRVATSSSDDYNPRSSTRTNEDTKTGYYNPFETLAKVILTPNTERAKQRVEERQKKRVERLEKRGASKEKIERVKTRQADVRKQRGFDKK